MRPAAFTPCLALLLGIGFAHGAGAEPFVFVALPDTQIYADDRFPGERRTPAVTDERGTGAIFFDQTRWIVEHEKELGIRYVAHLGDIVQNGDDLDEWALAHDAMHLLRDADIPHGTVMGNHDDNHGPDYMRNYLDHFGPDEFAGRPWYTASSPGGGANLQILEHAHRKLGFLNFSIDHPQSEIDWATGIVQASPDTIFVIGTHRYLWDFKIAGGRYHEDVPSPLGTINIPGGPVGGVVDPNTAQQLFDEFVSQHPNVLMIHAGHFHAEWLRLDETNSAGQTIIQILTDYQSTRNGGDGWLRVYELDFDAGAFSFDTYSPTLERLRSTIDHYVETIYLAYDQRDQIKEVLGVEDDAIYFALLRAAFGRSPAIPDDFLKQHPDLDEPEEQAYFDQYLSDLFLGDVPELFSNIHDWEQLWMTAFAKDPDDPFDFEDWVRSPRHTRPVDFSAYFEPSPEQRLAFAFEDLLDALEALEQDDLAFPTAARPLSRKARRAFHHFESGRISKATKILEERILPRTDGCALRAEADPKKRPSFRYDWITDCAAQDTVYPLLIEAIELSASLGTP